jgi:hypothetical protein
MVFIGTVLLTDTFLYQQALATRQMTLGMDHPHTQSCFVFLKELVEDRAKAEAEAER